ncbi:MAG: hypothetical protein ACOCXQ_01785 [Patescibacteria group bacterium]
MKKIAILLLVISTLILAPLSPLWAQTGDDSQIGFANYYDIQSDNLSEGDIIVLTENVYRKSNKAYDFKMIGVVTENPAVALDFTQGDRSSAVVVSGVSPVKVSGENGPIVEGDYLTTSSVPGVGMKATEPGYVLGVALEPFNGETAEDIQLINASLEVDYSFNPLFKGGESGERASRNLMDIFTLSSVAVYESPSTVFKYVVAAFIIVFCVALGFLTFSRVASNGVSAIGRNPMAGKMINLGIFINVLLTVVIIGAGVVVAYIVVLL